MNSYVQLITSKPVMTNVANSLKIPTVQAKKIIKMTSPIARGTTVTILTDSPDQKIPIVSSAIGRTKCEPLSLDKTGGLFDIQEEEDKSDLDMDFEHINFNDLNNNQSACLTPPIHIIANPIDTIEIPPMPKKKFSDKLSDANLKVKIIKPDTLSSSQPLTEMTPFMDLDLEDLKLNEIMTPSIEKECLQYLQAIQADEEDNKLKSARILSNNQIMNSLGVNDTDLQSMLNTGGFVNTTVEDNVFLSQTTVIESKPKPPALKLNTSSVDHVYHTTNKRSITSLLDDDEASSASFASESLNNSVNVPCTSASLTSGAKRQRTRGIYRAEDITNEEDLQNYLERRKKNNISSKISRANKKNMYSQMDQRSVELENENRMLERKVQKLEEINKLMKDYLIENFSNKIK